MINLIGKAINAITKPVEAITKLLTKPLDLMLGAVGGGQNPASNAFKTLLNPFS